MKKIIYLMMFFFVLAVSCKFPRVARQGDKDYSLMNWEGGEFVYATYIWKGGKFDDALDIIKEFMKPNSEPGAELTRPKAVSHPRRRGLTKSLKDQCVERDSG